MSSVVNAFVMIYWQNGILLTILANVSYRRIIIAVLADSADQIPHQMANKQHAYAKIHLLFGQKHQIHVLVK